MTLSSSSDFRSKLRVTLASSGRVSSQRRFARRILFGSSHFCSLTDLHLHAQPAAPVRTFPSVRRPPPRSHPSPQDSSLLRCSLLPANNVLSLRERAPSNGARGVPFSRFLYHTPWQSLASHPYPPVATSERRRCGSDALRAAPGSSVGTAFHPRPPRRRDRAVATPLVRPGRRTSVPRGAYLLPPASSRPGSSRASRSHSSRGGSAGVNAAATVSSSANPHAWSSRAWKPETVRSLLPL